MTATSLMAREAAEAPAVIERLITSPAVTRTAQDLRDLDPKLVLTCARGTSDQAATYFQYLLPVLLDIPCYSHAPSLSSLLGATSPRLAGAAFTLISQSGRSPDLLRSAAAARDAGMRLVGFVNDDRSELARTVEHLIPVGAGPEQAVPATKSFVATLAAMAMLAADWRGDVELRSAINRLPADLETAWDTDWDAALEPAVAAEHLLVLGRDFTLGIAGEAALKLKESSALHAEALSLAEVRHGPMALVGPDVPVLAFPSEAAVQAGALDLLAGFVARGATVMVAGYEVPGALGLPIAKTHPLLRPILAIQSFYRLAERIARGRGLDPDRPASLSKVTRTL